MSKQGSRDQQQNNRSNELGIAERTHAAVKQGVQLTQAQMLGVIPMPKQFISNDQEVRHR